MIEVLSDMPNGVTGIRVSGRLRGEDLREFKPAMEALVNTEEIRIVEVIASDYEGFGRGGLVEDLKLGFGVSSSTIRPSSESRWCPTRSGSPIRCMRWRGWFPGNSPSSVSTNSSGPRNGPRAKQPIRRCRHGPVFMATAS